MSGFAKGTDGKTRTVKNPLEGATGDIGLDDASFRTLEVSGNAVFGNASANGFYWANGTSIVYGNANVDAYLPTYGGNISTDAIEFTGGNIINGSILTFGNLSAGGINIAPFELYGGTWGGIWPADVPLTSNTVAFATTDNFTGDFSTVIGGNQIYIINDIANVMVTFDNLTANVDVYGNINVTDKIQGNVTFSPANPGDWADPGNIATIADALNQLANMIANP